MQMDISFREESVSGDLASALQALERAGVTRLYAKLLSENDNSKNQIYFGPGFEAVNLFPNLGVTADQENPTFKARLDFHWISSDGVLHHAPHAQLILYPQYPEVRFSGFMKGCAMHPGDLVRRRLTGRILLLGITAEQRIIGLVLRGTGQVEERLKELSTGQVGVFLELPTSRDSSVLQRDRLLAELLRIHRKGWIDSKQLRSDGLIGPCNAPQCGGFTLEAELGVAKNSNAEPDFAGYEVKQHNVSNFTSPGSSAITLMTPEPTGGYYKDVGVEAFIRRFGYADRNNTPDRLNVGGVYRVGKRHSSTGLSLELTGYDSAGKFRQDGAIALVADDGTVAASWSMSSFLTHWMHKHAKAVYVPSMKRLEPSLQYSFGHIIRLGSLPDFVLLLKAFITGKVYYDPGIKMEQATSSKPRVKRRSQFRIHPKDLEHIYTDFSTVDLTNG